MGEFCTGFADGCNVYDEMELKKNVPLLPSVFCFTESLPSHILNNIDIEKASFSQYLDHLTATLLFLYTCYQLDSTFILLQAVTFLPFRTSKNAV